VEDLLADLEQAFQAIASTAGSARG
jgi:hypothetical protein